MPIAFPSSPTQGQTTVTGGRTWTWDGVSWAAASTVDLIAVSSNVTPVSTLAYDLGSSSLRWRDLYMSGNTIDLGGTAIKSSANGVSFTSAANAAAAVPLTVSSLQIASATGNVVTLQATATGLQTVATSGNVVATTPGGSSGHVQYNLAGAFAGSANLTFDGTNLNVGSGTVSTTRTLNVLGSQSIERYGATPQLAIRGGTDSTTGKDLRFNLTQTYLTIGAATIGGTQNNWLTFDFSNPSMNFALDGTEGMRLTSTGLGIGTSSPVYRLDVAGGVARIQNSGANAELLLTDSGTTNGAVRVRGVSNQLQIVSGGGTTATFDSSGNLGLGVTPSGWASPFIALESGSVSNQWQSSVGFQTNNSVVSLNTNTFYNGSNYIYKYSKAASRFIVNSNSFEWQLAPSGTAGNAITFTQAMTLNASGNLGIGETNPSGRLHVKTTGITASAPGFGWPVYNAEYDTNSRSVYIDTAGNGSVSTAGYGATVALVLGQYYDSRVVITASGNGGASPGDQGTANGKDMLIKAGHSDNGVGYKGGRLYLSGGMGYTSGGYNGNVGNVIIQPFGGDLLVGTTSGLGSGYRLVVNGTAFTQTPTGSDIYQGHTLIIQEQDGTNFVANKSIALGFNMSCGGGFTSHGKIALVKENGTSGNQSTRFEFWTRNGANNSTADAERLRISSTGSLGVYGSVSVSSGTHTLSDLGSSPHTVRLYNNTDSNNSTNRFLLCDAAASVLRAEIRSNGGIANYSANNANLSDRREKTNFAPAKSYLDTICAIPVQTFNYIDQSEDDPGSTLGVVAQDVQAVAPELVMESNWGTEDNPKMRLSIYQTDLQYALMKCIQEQQAMIQQLQADLALLKNSST